MSTPNTHAEVAKVEHDRHAHGWGQNVVVLLILGALTLSTFGVSKLTMSENAHLYAALGIAAVKVSLVVLFFMHLKDAEGSNKVAFGLALVFVAVLMWFVMEDVNHRWKMTRTQQVWVAEPDYDQYPQHGGEEGAPSAAKAGAGEKKE